ncbi:MAG: hypothetical protein LUG99_08700 [Lachnospiraceae bacterium]|nr:hypothetical protein [Lachnospiraceae bacterium]
MKTSKDNGQERTVPERKTENEQQTFSLQKSETEMSNQEAQGVEWLPFPDVNYDSLTELANVMEDMDQKDYLPETVAPKATLEGNEKTVGFQIDLEGREKTDEKAERMVKEYLSYAPYLEADDSYGHHIEQLYMMCREGFSKEFIEDVFCYGKEIGLVSLDLLRCIALIGGEEFAMRFYNGNFSLDEVRAEYADFAAMEKFSQFDEIEKLRHEAERACERFDLQMEFLKKEQENSKAYADDRIRSEREAAEERLKQQKEYSEEKIRSLKTMFETEKSLLQSEADRKRDALETELGTCTVKLDSVQKELDTLRTQLEAAQVENNKLVEERSNLMSENEKLKTQATERALQPGNTASTPAAGNQLDEASSALTGNRTDKASPNVSGNTDYAKNLADANSSADSNRSANAQNPTTDGNAGGAENSTGTEKRESQKKEFLPFHQKHKRKESRKRDDFIIDLIKNPGYTDEQFDIIYAAVKAGMPLKELEQIRNPELPARNMQMLANYFMRKDAGIPAEKEANENGRTDENHPAGGSGERA